MIRYMIHFLVLLVASSFSLLLFLVIVSMALNLADSLRVFTGRVIEVFLVFLSIFVAFTHVKMWKVVLKELQGENE
ncbi:hypothetical protein LCGC14_1711150 [marine sediment metagenome]|uniref:Uncharacterized protein n=1 Tax=marine sediment metagenome TaxID=412755 RepID=A0A0F9JVL4_9ZZZZ